MVVEAIEAVVVPTWVDVVIAVALEPSAFALRHTRIRIRPCMDVTVGRMAIAITQLPELKSPVIGEGDRKLSPTAVALVPAVGPDVLSIREDALVYLRHQNYIQQLEP